MNPRRTTLCIDLDRGQAATGCAFGPDTRLMFRLWLLSVPCAAVVLHGDANNPIDWQTALVQAFIMATPITISMAVSYRFLRSLHLRPVHEFSLLWIAFMVGVLGYDALFPLVFGGRWDFAGGVRTCVELHFMYAIAGVWVAFSLRMRGWRQKSAREDR